MEDNINMDHTGIGCGGMNWTNLDEDMHGTVATKPIRFHENKGA
jgi:hypothetical protein